MEQEKNNEINAKSKTLLLVIVIMVVIGAILLRQQFSSKNANKIANNNVSKISDTIYFYKDGEEYKYTKDYESITDEENITSKYECINECNVLETSILGSFGLLSTNKAFIYTDNKYILFDFTNAQVINEYSSDDMTWLYKKGSDYGEGEYIYIKSLDDKYGIIDKNGNVIHDFIFENSLSIRFEDGTVNNTLMEIDKTYSIEDNIIGVSIDGKYGISKITSNDMVVDNKYDNIGIIDSKYYIAKENDKWYVYNIENKNKQIEEGFNRIYPSIRNVLMVQVDNKIYFRDYNNKNLIEDTLNVDSKCESYTTPCITFYNIHETEEPNVYRIIGYRDMSNGQQAIYLYDANNNKLTANN